MIVQTFRLLEKKVETAATGIVVERVGNDWLAKVFDRVAED